ncbi:MAG: hypothetical protein WD894_22170 [Pirellulales bacterium]
MAHLLIPQPSDPVLPVFFNVDAVVGAPPASNLREDVLLVQLAFKILALRPVASTPPTLVAAASAVEITGSIDQATIIAIRKLQETLRDKNGPAQVVDGRVSRAQGGFSYGGGSTWTIVQLNNIIQDRHKHIWPRIDKIPGCPGELQKMVVRTVAGV